MFILGMTIGFVSGWIVSYFQNTPKPEWRLPEHSGCDCGCDC